eukprot:4209835-Alexandrium_andersonii.AAC.1
MGVQAPCRRSARRLDRGRPCRWSARLVCASPRAGGCPAVTAGRDLANRATGWRRWHDQPGSL